KKRLPSLRFKLVARDKENNLLASVEIDNWISSILKYATRLAENLAQNSIDLQTCLSLEYFLSDDSEESSTTTDESNRLIHLIYLIYQMASSFDKRNSMSFKNQISEIEEGESWKYHSHRLTKLIRRQLCDSTALGLCIIPHWCYSLDHQISILIPFDLRIKLLRFCGFGFSRTMAWLHSVKIIEKIRKNCRGHFRLPIQQKSSQSSADSPNILRLLRAHHAFVTDIRRSPLNWQGSIAKCYTGVQKDPLDSDDGKAFWVDAIQFLNEGAESKNFFEFIFEGEIGYGVGVDRDFYSELSREFRRKSGFMWLDSSKKEDSPFVHTTFGLFPTPYPRHLVPLEVLKRFHILGISIARAIQDGFLLDLPLSEPLVKIIVCYSRAMENLRRNNRTDLQTSYQTLENIEKCRETIFSSNAFIGHCNSSGTVDRHWLTGLLDAEDFLVLYPHFRNLLPELLELYQRQKQSLESMNCCEVKQYEFLDKNSKELLGVVLDDLCIPMAVHCPSHANSTTVKLCDIYPWESADANLSSGDDDEIEYVTNDNYVDFIRRLLEFCLDKGIRAQMEAFVEANNVFLLAGFERVFPLKWLSMFTCTEVKNLISGQTAENPWSRDELKLYIDFSGFAENSKTIQYFLDTLVSFDAENRRKFMRFVTGCSTLPTFCRKETRCEIRGFVGFTTLTRLIESRALEQAGKCGM
ncbi:hypothetical protein ACTXT7_013714, partial [Hymenolepis weldensis]